MNKLLLNWGFIKVGGSGSYSFIEQSFEGVTFLESTKVTDF